jgi:hypothetical protein
MTVSQRGDALLMTRPPLELVLRLRRQLAALPANRRIGYP